MSRTSRPFAARASTATSPARGGWRRHRLVWLTGLLIALLIQIADVPGVAYSGPPQTPAPAQPESPDDPVGRSTPRGTITGFILAVNRSDFTSAERFLQMPSRGGSGSETLARSLSGLMDRYFNQPVTAISGDPAGELTDGLALDRERVGPLEIPGAPVDIVLVRVTDAGRQIWLISSETLAQVPALHRAIGQTWVESVMPSALVNHGFFDLSFAQWVVWTASIVVPFVIFLVVFRLAVAIVRRGPDRAWRLEVERWYAALRRPAALTLTLGAHMAALPLIGFSVRFRLAYGRAAIVIAIVLVVWLLRRLATLAFAHFRSLMPGVGHAGTRSLSLLAERVLKVTLTLLALLLILAALGVDTKTALAGLGIGGVAVALGAQKTVENLLGGVFLLTDRALAVGDFCSISNRLGTVEDITLRSVRLRTLEQTLLSIPAGVLSQTGVENFSTRGKILVQATLRLRYGSTADQLKQIIERTRKLLAAHADLEPESARIRLVNFGVSAIEVELFAYVVTSDALRFMEVREDLLLQIATIVEASGSGFADPTRAFDALQARP